MCYDHYTHLPLFTKPYFVMEKRTFKNRIYKELARIVKAMANPHRLEIVELLAQGEYSVEEVAEQIDITVANTSQHLQVLKRGQLVETRREGNRVYYFLADENVYKAWKALRDLGIERAAEIERTLRRFRESKHSVETLDHSELLQKMENEEVTVIDVRPEQEFDEGHIAGALNIPVERLEEKLDDLPADQEIVAYCRGPFCVFADQAVDLLKEKGYTAHRLDEGFPEWNLEKFPIESSKDHA